MLWRRKVWCFKPICVWRPCLGEVGVIQRRRVAVSVSTLRNDVKRSVWEKQDSVNVSRFCDHYMVCPQNARRLSAGWNLKEIESVVEKKLKKCNQCSRENYQRKSCSANIIQQQSVVKLNLESLKEKSDHCLYFDTHFLRNFRVNMVAAID